jgi:hypothetical protein
MEEQFQAPVSAVTNLNFIINSYLRIIDFSLFADRESQLAGPSLIDRQLPSTIVNQFDLNRYHYLLFVLPLSTAIHMA